MATGNHISCGPCMFDDVTKDAGRWCTNCEEGLCEDCENVHRKGKTTRNHRVISIEDYRKIEHVSISQVCEHHGENLEWFCTNHDEVLCVVCVPSNHKACSDVIPISAILANARQSTALSDLEETMERTLANVKQCIKNRESATKGIEKQELAVKTMVLETRTKINTHLDKLQKQLLKELRLASQTCKSKYVKILRKLKSTEEMLTKLREQTMHIKQFSSDIQVFLGTHRSNIFIKNEVESLKSEISVTKDYELKVDVHSIIKKLSSEVVDFGQIKVTECDANLHFKNPKIEQAQIEVSISRDISTVKLQLIKSFQMTSTHEIDITGCVILPNGQLLIANDTKENHLREYRDTGEHIRDIRVSGRPFDIAVIYPNRIVVTYGYTKLIEILNINTFQVESKINVREQCWGVSYQNGMIYVVGYSSIRVLDLSGNQLKALQMSLKNVKSITTSRDMLFYTDFDSKNVHCCLQNGEELWQFTIEYLVLPYGVTVDNNHNVYVVDYISKTLTIIQHDGKKSQIVLTKSDGLENPRAVYYDKNNRKLLICNEGGKVALYKDV